MSIIFLVLGVLIVESVIDGICDVFDKQYKRTHNKRKFAYK